MLCVLLLTAGEALVSQRLIGRSRQFCTRETVVVHTGFAPLMREPCLKAFDEWDRLSHHHHHHGSSSEMLQAQYSEALFEVRRWAENELSDVPFVEMSEDAQRGLDSWAFAVETSTPTEIGAIWCAELVTQISHSQFYWPTVRLVHLAVRPTSEHEAGSLILKAAGDAVKFCDANRLQLDYSRLRLAFAPPHSQLSLTELSAQSALITWVDGAIDWAKLFTSLRGKDTYSADDFIPGAT